MNEEEFANALDGIVNGTFPASSDPLVSFARQMHERESQRMPEDRRTAIWKQLMATHPHDTPTTGGAGPLSQPTLTDPIATNPWVQRSSRPGPKRTRLGAVNNGFQVSITALAVVTIVIAAFATFPIIRGDRGPEITPTAFAAAPTTSAPTASTDMLGMNATQALPGTAAASPDLPGATATPHPGGDLPIMIPTATNIPWFPYPPVIDPGPAGPVDGTPGPFTPAPIPPILPPRVPRATPPPPIPSSPPTPSATYHHPRAAACTVEPLTVYEIMAVLEGDSSGQWLLDEYGVRWGETTGS